MKKEKSKTAKRIMKSAMIIGVLVIPLLYSYFYLGAFWDPYAKLDEVPVAVVNLDKGATINNEKRNVGNEICENLKADGSVKFIFTDEKTADAGVLGNDYYAEIILPEDLSSSVSTVSKDTDKIHGTITYKANQKKNYLAAQILENAMPTIKESVNSSIDEEIVCTLSDKLYSVPDSLAVLQDGLKQLYDGSNKLDNSVETLHEGTIELHEGTSKLSSKIPSLTTGVSLLDDGVNQVYNGVGKLSDGTSQVADGMSNLRGGIDTLYSTMSSNGKLGSGTQQLSDGMSQLYNSLTSNGDLGKGTQQLADGTSSLYSAMKEDGQLGGGVKSLSDGATTYANTIYSSIISSLKNSGSAQLATLAGGITPQQIASLYSSTSPYSFDNTAYGTHVANRDNYFALSLYGLSHYTVSATSTTYDLTSSTDYANLVTFFATYDSSNLATDVASIQKMVDSYNTLKSTGQLYVGAAALSKGASTVNTAIESLVNSSATDGSNGVYLLYKGANTLNDSIIYEVSANGDVTALKNGAIDLNNAVIESVDASATDGSNGLYILKTGASTLDSATTVINDNMGVLYNKLPALVNGMNTLSTSAPTLAKGATALEFGASKLENGASKIKNDGTSVIKSGLKTAKDGVDETVVDTDDQLGALDGLSDYAGEPVSTQTQYVQSVENYGSAFAPYFMSLSLWVGGLMIFFGIFLDYEKKIKVLSRDSNNVVVRGFVFLLLGLLQATLLTIVIKYFLGIVVNNLFLLFVSCIVVSMTFVSIIQFCIVHLKDLGKFISLLLLILQLTSCAGTFPLETLPDMFQKLYPYMPMTYSVGLFKEAISGTWGSNAQKDMLILAIIAIVFFAVTAVLSVSKKAKEDRETAESLKAQKA